MNGARAAATVGGVELRRRTRDWSFPIQGIIGPIVIAVIVGLAFGNVGEPETVTIGIVDADGTATGSESPIADATQWQSGPTVTAPAGPAPQITRS